MVTHGGLRYPEWLDEIARRASLPSCSQETDQPQSGGVGQDTEPAGELLGAYLIDRLDPDRGARIDGGSRHAQRQYLSESSDVII